MSKRRTSVAEELAPRPSQRSSASVREPEEESSRSAASPAAAVREPDSFRKLVLKLWVGPLCLFIILAILKWVFGF